MNVQAEKLKLIGWISDLNDLEIVNELMQIKNEYLNSSNRSDALKKEEIDSINRGLKDFEEGKVHAHETARKVYEKYL